MKINKIFCLIIFFFKKERPDQGVESLETSNLLAP